jgi:hypothetical protein
MASSTFLVGIDVLCGLWLLSITTTSSFSSSAASQSVRIFTHVGALFFVGDRLLADCALGAEDGVPAIVGRPSGLTVRTVVVSASVRVKVKVSSACCPCLGAQSGTVGARRMPP